MAIVEKVDGFFIPNVTLIGVGAAKAIPERIVYLNATKPLLVTDKGIVHTGILKQITDILDEAAYLQTYLDLPYFTYKILLILYWKPCCRVWLFI